MEREEQARRNRTMEDLEKGKQSEVMYMPPARMEETQKGLCTYVHLLEMLGFVNNAHYTSVMDTRRTLHKLLTQKESINPHFSWV